MISNFICISKIKTPPEKRTTTGNKAVYSFWLDFKDIAIKVNVYGDYLKDILEKLKTGDNCIVQGRLEYQQTEKNGIKTPIATVTAKHVSKHGEEFKANSSEDFSHDDLIDEEEIPF